MSFFLLEIRSDQTSIVVDYSDESIRTFKLFEYLGQEKVPLIPYYLNSPRDDKSKKNQPSRYNDKTIIGDGVLNADNFQVSEKFGGRIMPE